VPVFLKEPLLLRAGPYDDEGVKLRKPALDLSDLSDSSVTGALQWTVAGFARPRRTVKPNAAWRRAEGAGLTAKARTEQSSMSPQYALSS
jgi:hypothetical protein